MNDINSDIELKYKAGLIIKPGMPPELQEVILRVKEELEKSLTPEQFKEIAEDYHCSYDDCNAHLFGDKREWVIGSNFEDGSSSVVYKVDTKEWFYRSRWDGSDKPTKGGALEAIAHLKAMFYDI